MRTLIVLILLSCCFLAVPAQAAWEGNVVVTFADNPRILTDTLANDEDLHLSLEGGTVYEIDVTVFVEQGDGDVQVALAGEDGLSWTGVHGTATANIDGFTESLNLTNFDDPFPLNGNSGLVTITYHLVGKTDDAGTLVVQWAQRVSDPDPTSVLRGSIMRVRYL